jgi:broad specificity phosphatase PhoE
MLPRMSPRPALLLSLVVSLACAGSKPTAVPAPTSAAAPTVVLLVRHAEKATGEDPVLTPAGEQRAQALVHALKDAEVKAIYSTPYRRTQQTAAPLAARLGLPVTVRDADEKSAADFIRELVRTHAGSTVLVVGHSNTLPALAEALTGMKVPPIGDGTYDTLFVATLPAAGPPHLLTLRYGAASTP